MLRTPAAKAFLAFAFKRAQHGVNQKVTFARRFGEKKWLQRNDIFVISPQSKNAVQLLVR